MLQFLEALAIDLQAPRPTLFVTSIPTFGEYAVLGAPPSFWLQLSLVSAAGCFLVAHCRQRHLNLLTLPADVGNSVSDISTVCCHSVYAHC